MNTTMSTGSAVAGFASGLRTFLPLAITLASERSAWTGLTGTLAAGEVIGDKLPFAPPRTQPGALIGRMLAGGYCGYLVAKRADGSPRAGAVLGAAGAVAGTILGYNVRKYLTVELGFPDALIALAEDGLTFGLARFANA